MRVAVDCFHDELAPLPGGAVIVGVDVIRSTTTAITAVAAGHRCFVVGSLDEAAEVARELGDALLVGELGGNMPFGFDFTNSPVAITALDSVHRPLVLLSSSGTRLLSEAARRGPTVAACLRNWQAQAAELVRMAPPHVAILGAGTRGEFREEDQLCAAWIAAALVDAGADADRETLAFVERWRDEPVGRITEGRSAAYLRSSGQMADLAYILDHVADLDVTYEVRDREVVARAPGAPLA